MKVVDVIFALIIGRFVGFIMEDFLREWGIGLIAWESLLLWLVIPFLAVFFLWLANYIGQKFLVVYQAAKHILVGAFATVVDFKLFFILDWISHILFFSNPLVPKSISFVVATSIKYVGNKFWTFQKHEKEQMAQEIAKFFGIMMLGLLIDVSVFFLLTTVIGSQFGLSSQVWVKISVLVAAAVAAIWNFTGDKFLVFKK